MGTSLISLLLLSVLISTALSYDRFIPGRYAITTTDKRFPDTKFLRTLSESSDEYQKKIDSSHNANIITMRLRGDTQLGYFYITLFFGVPLQKQTLIVDTGSVTTTVPCIECDTNCGPHHFNKPFNHTGSETYKTFDCLERFGNYVCNDCNGDCSFSVGYVEGSSYSGHYKKDYITFGNEIEDLFYILQGKTSADSNRLLQGDSTSSDPNTSSNEGTDVQPLNDQTKIYQDSNAPENQDGSDDTQSSTTPEASNNEEDAGSDETATQTETVVPENEENDQSSSNNSTIESSGAVVDNQDYNTLSSQQEMQNTTSSNYETTTSPPNATQSQSSENNATSPAPTMMNSSTPTGALGDAASETDAKYQSNKALVESTVSTRKTFMPFGCTFRETNLFYDQEADGILGLGINTDTNGNPPNLVDIIHSNHPDTKKAFSLCLSQNGGYFTTGGYNFAYHQEKEKIYHTDYYDNYGQYRVYFNRIEMDGRDLGLNVQSLNNGQGAFFDSGTTLTHVQPAIYKAIKQGIFTYCSTHGSSCGRRILKDPFCYYHDPQVFPTVLDFMRSFPTFTFYFGNNGDAKYEWKGEDYLAHKGEEANKYCMGISQYKAETILGGTFMKNHDILFDKENKKIAFVRAECGSIMDVTVPDYLYTTKAEPQAPEIPDPVPETTPTSPTTEESETAPPSTTVSKLEQTPPSTTIQANDQEDDSPRQKIATIWQQAKVYFPFVVIAAVLGVIACVVVKLLRKKKYNNMQNEVEMPEKVAGLSFESQTNQLPGQEGEQNNNGTHRTINSLVEVSI